MLLISEKQTSTMNQNPSETYFEGFLFMSLYIKIIFFKPNYRDKTCLNFEKSL